jgi:hypothetical protein
MPISSPQIPGSLTTIGQMVGTLNSLAALLNEAQVLVNQNWILTLAPNVTLAITADQQTALVAQYDTLKAQLVTQFGALP